MATLPDKRKKKKKSIHRMLDVGKVQDPCFCVQGQPGKQKKSVFGSVYLNAWQDVVEDDRLANAGIQILAELLQLFGGRRPNLGLAVLQQTLQCVKKFWF
jgi:hypothetical protein